MRCFMLKGIVYIVLMSFLFLGYSQENIPDKSNVGKHLINVYSKDGIDLNERKMAELLLKFDLRGVKSDPAYALLDLKVNKIDSVTGLPILDIKPRKGSGTVLYRSGDYILLLTAWHNIRNDSLKDPFQTVMMSLILDSGHVEKASNKKVVLATMVSDNYERVDNDKDIALIAMELTEQDKIKNLFEDKKIIFGIYDLAIKSLEGLENSVNIDISHYPSFFTSYVKHSGQAYHEKGKGYHTVPTLPGSSGAALFMSDSNKIIGVHHHQGDQLTEDYVSKITYRGNQILVKNNYYDLISYNDIQKTISDIESSTRKRTKKLILLSLLKDYMSSMSEDNKKEDL